MRWIAMAFGIIACGAAQAAGAPADERAQVRAEIARVEQQAAAEEAACRQRFIVTSCVDEVRSRRREALAPLNARMHALDDVERQRRTQERRKAVAEKQRQVAARPLPPADAPAASAPRRSPVAASGPSRRADAPTAEARQHEAQAEAAARAAAAARRREQINETSERIRQRIEARDRKGKPSAPLPVPDAASIPR